MYVTVKLFASLREAAGREQLRWELPDEATVGRLIRELRSSLPGLDSGIGRARVAINRRYAGADDRLQEGDEVALFPPVSGG
jgi:molybdopterin converting factor subunit 1